VRVALAYADPAACFRAEIRGKYRDGKSLIALYPPKCDTFQTRRPVAEVARLQVFSGTFPNSYEFGYEILLH
jgi:hypothetical protein